MPVAPLLSVCKLDSELVRSIAAAPLPAIGAGCVDADAVKALESWLAKETSLPDCCRAGLWLLAGDLERSHIISQAIDTPDGSYWHGIMHRREGDYENAKYWFRRAGNHAVLYELARESELVRDRSGATDLPWSSLQDSRRVAGALVDCCRDYSSPVVQEIAWLEWQLLFRHCLVSDS